MGGPSRRPSPSGEPQEASTEAPASALAEAGAWTPKVGHLRVPASSPLSVLGQELVQEPVAILRGVVLQANMPPVSITVN